MRRSPLRLITDLLYRLLLKYRFEWYCRKLQYSGEHYRKAEMSFFSVYEVTYMKVTAFIQKKRRGRKSSCHTYVNRLLPLIAQPVPHSMIQLLEQLHFTSGIARKHHLLSKQEKRSPPLPSHHISSTFSSACDPMVKEQFREIMQTCDSIGLGDGTLHARFQSSLMGSNKQLFIAENYIFFETFFACSNHT